MLVEVSVCAAALGFSGMLAAAHYSKLDKSGDAIGINRICCIFMCIGVLYLADTIKMVCNTTSPVLFCCSCSMFIFPQP